jgi:hypothetical protein
LDRISWRRKTTMMRLIVTVFVFAVLACGGSDTAPTGEAAPEGAAGGEMAAAPDTPEPPATVDPKVQGCLDLIRQSKYQEALPVCLAALKIDPGNQQVQDAVEKAQTETAKLAAAEAATEAAGGAAADEAASQLGDAAGKLGH